MPHDTNTKQRKVDSKTAAPGGPGSPKRHEAYDTRLLELDPGSRDFMRKVQEFVEGHIYTQIPPHPHVIDGLILLAKTFTATQGIPPHEDLALHIERYAFFNTMEFEAACDGYSAFVTAGVRDYHEDLECQSRAACLRAMAVHLSAEANRLEMRAEADGGAA